MSDVICSTPPHPHTNNTIRVCVYVWRHTSRSLYFTPAVLAFENNGLCIRERSIGIARSVLH